MDYMAELERLDRELYPEKYAGEVVYTHRGRPPKEPQDMALTRAELPRIGLLTTSVRIPVGTKAVWNRLARDRRETLTDTLVWALSLAEKAHEQA
jgi:hypothetical protein